MNTWQKKDRFQLLARVVTGHIEVMDPTVLWAIGMSHGLRIAFEDPDLGRELLDAAELAGDKSPEQLEVAIRRAAERIAVAWDVVKETLP